MGASVLIIDSDESFVGEAKAALEAFGIQVSVTSDGNAAVGAALESPPDAIVLCAELPATPGYAVCAKLKKQRVLIDVPVVITSSNKNRQVFEQHMKLKSRAQDYLVKPTDMAMLLNSLSAFLPELSEQPVTLGDDEVFNEAESQALEAEPQDAIGDFGSEPTAAVDSELDDVFRGLEGRAGVEKIGDADEDALTAVSPLLEEELRASASAPPQTDFADEIQRLMQERDDAVQTADALRASTRPSEIPGGRTSRDMILLKKERNTLEAEVRQLRQRLQEADETRAEWRKHEETLDARVLELEECVERAGDDRAAMDAQLLSEKAKAAEAQRHSQELKRKSADQQEKIDALEADAGGHREALEQSNAALDEARKLSKRLSEEMEALTARLEERETSQQRMEADHASMSAALGEAEAERDEAKLEADKDRLRAEQAETEREEQQAEAADLQLRLDKLAADLSHVSNEAEASSAEASSLRTQLERRGEEVIGLNEQLGEMTTLKDAVSAKLEAAREAVVEAEARYGALKKRLDTARTKIAADGEVRVKALKALEIAAALVQETGYKEPKPAPPPRELSNTA